MPTLPVVPYRPPLPPMCPLFPVSVFHGILPSTPLSPIEKSRKPVPDFARKEYQEALGKSGMRQGYSEERTEKRQEGDKDMTRTHAVGP